MSMDKTTIPGIDKPVGRVGFGLMLLTMCPEDERESDEEAFEAMKTAIDSGSNLWVTGSFYGPPDDLRANLKLIRRFFDKYPQYLDEVVLGMKGGMGPGHALITDLDELRADVKDCQSALGAKKIDVFEYGRVPRDAPIEKVISNFLTLRSEGLFTAISISEATASTFTRAHSVTPVSFNELELSLWSLEPEILEAVEAAAKAGVPVLAYSPLGRGFLTGRWKTPEDIPEGHPRKMFPRFQGENFYKNMELVKQLEKISQKTGRTTAQLALAYIMTRFDNVIPIPGSGNPTRVRENVAAASMRLTKEEMEEIDAILASFKPEGDRYPEFAKGMLMG
ncbi:hypothetical protein TREMEDRAFT_61458 [Tremella mesenterica DSM 1558]|uniref:uncharacterized protein n=1 Tax=Tremella mesenterica (strain ATCC 24925 / CBS 8224 / DSM 1558 / NBRC 9311 / NRRL Y-6157 / RJB 2259-6 / UBC 559-6) TaxID=578456 RepID=UPI0003F48F07|nr:uncharacterized protein TREMEDRAFT_61458 [Tremella mesenterica DSM 1558]EIW70943.1 hypothetical protein TREMEDRAFT_61458 [Tremella mesenterica DSM 1558]